MSKEKNKTKDIKDYMTSPGLVLVRDLLDRFPDYREELLAYEIRRREQEDLLYLRMRSFLYWRAWDSVQGLAIVSAIWLFVLWTMRSVLRVGEWIEQTERDGWKLPEPLDRAFGIQWRAVMIATDPLQRVSTMFGSWRWQVVGLVLAGGLFALLIRHLAILIFTWKELRPLRAASYERQQEIKILQAWKV